MSKYVSPVGLSTPVTSYLSIGFDCKICEQSKTNEFQELFIPICKDCLKELKSLVLSKKKMKTT